MIKIAVLWLPSLLPAALLRAGEKLTCLDLVNRLTVAIPVKKDGNHKMIIQTTKAANYGTVQLSLDGERCGEPLDLYHQGVIPTGPFNLGVHELNKGDHRLRLEIVGANEKAANAYMIGLDYVKLESVP
jgi:hypothetical protein